MGTDYRRQQSHSDNSNNQAWIMTRRVFLKITAVGLAAAPLSCVSPPGFRIGRGTIRFGLVTDIHYADADTVGSRFYRHSLDKLTECVELMNAKTVDFLIELGDFKDQNSPPVEQKTISYLQGVEKVFQQFNGPTYHVLGNHDEDSISKAQFLSNIENTDISSDRSYYSFDFKGLHFVVLDANYKADGTDYDHGNFDWTDTNIPAAELAWLKEDLSVASGPVILFVHQLLDGTGSHYVKNADEVRLILQESGKVLTVFQGHYHQGSHRCIKGIHYYTLKALVEGPGAENNAYAIVEVLPETTIAITGYRKAVSKQFTSLAVNSAFS